MSVRVHIGGRVCLPEEAKISVFDRGFLYGDSVYETIGTVHGRLFALGDHLVRLERSALRIGVRPPPRAHIEEAVHETVAAAGNPESRVRVILTRGAGELDLDPASVNEPQLVIIVSPLGAPTAKMYAEGVSVSVVSVHRNSPLAIDPAVKSGNYLNNVLALGEARRTSGAYEAILCAGDGSIAEGSTSNVFAVVRGEVWTPQPDVGILDGITRAKVLELARGAGIAVVERRIQPAELRGADEAFLTSATRGVLPISTIDGRPVGAGVPGPVTKRLMALYDELARRGVE